MSRCDTNTVKCSSEEEGRLGCLIVQGISKVPSPSHTLPHSADLGGLNTHARVPSTNTAEQWRRTGCQIGTPVTGDWGKMVGKSGDQHPSRVRFVMQDERREEGLHFGSFLHLDKNDVIQ